VSVVEWLMKFEAFSASSVNVAVSLFNSEAEDDAGSQRV